MDVESLARVLVEGRLPHLRPSGKGEKDDFFPAMLAYEHKYNYKLKFLTDFNISIFSDLSVTNLVVGGLKKLI